MDTARKYRQRARRIRRVTLAAKGIEVVIVPTAHGVEFVIHGGHLDGERLKVPAATVEHLHATVQLATSPVVL